MLLADAEAARDGVRYLAERGSAAVKVWYIVDKDHPVEKSAPAVQAAGEAARERNLPLIVHATGLAEAKEALRAGAKLLVHSVGDQPVDDEFLDLAKKSGAIYCPTLTVFRGYYRMYTRRRPASGAGGGRPQRLRRSASPAPRSPRRRRRRGAGLRRPHQGPGDPGQRRRAPRRRQPQAGPRRRHPDRHGHRRRQSADPARPLGLRRDGGHAGGRPHPAAGPDRLHPRRRHGHGPGQGLRHRREGQARRPPDRRRRPHGRHRQPAQGALRGAGRGGAVDRGAQGAGDDGGGAGGK